MKVSKGQAQPEMVAAAFLLLYMVLGSPFLYQVLIVTHLEAKSLSQFGRLSQGQILCVSVS